MSYDSWKLASPPEPLDRPDDEELDECERPTLPACPIATPAPPREDDWEYGPANPVEPWEMEEMWRDVPSDVELTLSVPDEEELWYAPTHEED